MLDERVVFLLCACFSIISGSSPNGTESCINDDSHAVTVNEDADIFLGVILHVQDNRGIEKCGSPLKDAVEFYESLRWFTGVINQNSGQVESRIVTDSYIPGVKIGLRIYDSCGSVELAENLLSSLFPGLLNNCTERGPNVIGLIDCTGVTDDPVVQERLIKAYIPFMRIDLDYFFPQHEISQALVAFAKKMEWKRSSVLYSTNEHSMRIAESFSKNAKSTNLCIDSFVSISEEKLFGTLVKPQAGRWIVISPHDEVKESFQQITGPRANNIVLITTLIGAADSETITNLANNSTIFLVTGNPFETDGFESYWMQRKSPFSLLNSENRWLLEYLANTKKCIQDNAKRTNESLHWPLCQKFRTEESVLDKAIRHSKIVPAVHVINSFASSLRELWERDCYTRAEHCNFVEKFDRKAFSEIFRKTNFRHDGPGSRVPSGYSGFSSAGDRSALLDPRFTLLHFRGENSTLEPLITYQRSVGFEESNLTISAIQTVHPHHENYSTCSDFENSHTDLFTAKSSFLDATSQQGIAFDTSTPGITELTKSQDDEEKTTESTAIIKDNAPTDGESGDDDSESDKNLNNIIIPALFAVHKAGPTPLQCSSEINTDAVEHIEAFLWALDRINRNMILGGSVEVGAVIFDTCSSSIKAAHLVSSILSQEGDSMLQDINLDPDKILTFVTATSDTETEAVASILGSAHITTISTKGRGDIRKALPYLLQINVPMRVAAAATVDLLKHSGWTYVSVVVSEEDEDSYAGFHNFVEIADATEICYGTLERLNRTSGEPSYELLVDNVARASRHGAKVIVLWTNDDDTRNLLRYMAANEGESERLLKEMVWVHGNGGNMIHNIQELDINVKWMSLTPSLTVVQDFEDHFVQLMPESNDRNPWFHEFWDQIHNCTETEKCEQYPTSTLTTNVVQAVYVIASALTRLFEDRCSDNKDIWNCTSNIIELRQLLNKYFRYTGTDKADDSDGEFSFTEDRYSNIPLNILQVRHGSEGLTYERIGTYHGRVIDFNLSGFATESQCHVNSREACPQCIRKLQNQFLQRPSESKIYITAVFDVRQQSLDDGWYCSLNITDKGIQQMEAFFWIVEYINNSTDLLPGITLGAIGLDRCNSDEKLKLDLHKVLFNPNEDEFVENEDTYVVGLVSGTAEVDYKGLTEISSRFSLPVLTSAPAGKAKDINLLFHLGPSAYMIAASLAETIKAFNWSYVSLICSTSSSSLAAVCDEFRSAVSNHSVQLSLNIAVEENPSAEYWDAITYQVYSAVEQGTRILVTLIDSYHLESVLASLKRLQNLEQVLSQLVLVSWECEDIIIGYQDLLASALIAKPGWKQPEKYAPSFNLIPRHNSMNPWLSMYWAQRYGCRGNQCEMHHATKSVTFTDWVVPTMEGVLAIAYAMDHVREELCITKGGVCADISEEKDLRKRIQHALKENEFQDLDGETISFDSQGVSSKAGIKILNIVHSAENKVLNNIIGNYSLSYGLYLNTSLAKVTNTEIGLDHFTSVQSFCRSCVKEIKSMEPSTYMEILPRRSPGFSLLGFLPYHLPGNKQLTCGGVNSLRVFQNLAAISFALDQLHQNTTLPTSLHLGALVFDSCGRSEKAQQKLFSFMADNITETNFQTVIGIVTFDEESTLGIANIMDQENVPVFHIPLFGKKNDTSNFNERGIVLETVPSYYDGVLAITQILRQLEWRYVIVFYDDSASGAKHKDLFLNKTQSLDICIGAQIRVPKLERPEGDYSSFQTLLETISKDLPPLAVAVILLRDPRQIQWLFSEIDYAGLSDRFIALVNQAVESEVIQLVGSSKNQLGGLITVSAETHLVSSFDNFLRDLKPEKHSSIPMDWFDDFYQNYFKCNLKQSPVMQSRYPHPCSGNERLAQEDYHQDPYVYDTIAVLDIYVRSLSEFLHLHCRAGLQTSQISDCGIDAREKFSSIVARIHEETTKEHGVRGLLIWNGQFSANGSISYERVGSWRVSRTELSQHKLRFFGSPSIPEIECTTGPCVSICATQSTAEFTKTLSSPNLPEVPANFDTAWGVVTIAFCILGLTLVSGSGYYFYNHLPKTSLTYVSYLVTLVGLVLLYVTCIIYLLHPNETSCGLRRFLLGISYITLFASLLVRSLYSWRCIRTGETSAGPASCSASSSRSFDISEKVKPTALFVSTLSLIVVQVILASAWLLFKPATGGALLANGQWRCIPEDTFEKELVVSLTYPAIVLLAATGFSLFVSKSSDRPKDGKPMFTCCSLLVFTWIVWTLVATQTSYAFRDPAIVAGMIVCAKLVLIILHGRKIYDIAMHRQELESLAVLSQFSSKSLQNTHSELYAAGTAFVAHEERSSFGLRDNTVNFHGGNGHFQEEEYAHNGQGIIAASPCIADFFSGAFTSSPIAADTISDRSSSTDGEEFPESEESYPMPHLGFNHQSPSSLESFNLRYPNQPIVRRVGSRQILVIGDEAHGQVSRI